MRVLLYAHDGRGLGHVARACAVAEGLRAAWPDSDPVLVSGARELVSLAPRGVECIKLPSYASRRVGCSVTSSSAIPSLATVELASLRASLLSEIVQRLRPGVVLVDFLPLGKRNELSPALVLSQSMSPRPRWVLGMRQVIDSQGFANRDNLDRAGRQAIRRHYSAVLVYGHREVSDVGRVHGLRGAAVHYTGFPVRRSVLEARAHRRSLWRIPRVLLTFGSGFDATHAALAVLRQLRARRGSPLRVRVLCGPKQDRARIAAAALQLRSPRTEVECLDFTPDVAAHYAWATHVIGLAGSNTALEVLAAGIPSLLIARSLPESEQELLLECLCRRSDLIPLREREIGRPSCRAAIAALLSRRSIRVDSRLRFDGAETAARILRRIGSEPVAPPGPASIEGADGE